jgi:penicillin-binding protein 2
VRNYDYSEQIYERKSEVLATVKSARFNWDAVQDGMWRVANEPGGTGYETWFDYPYQVAAKTGTAQKGENIVNDGIFMCYAPYRDPQVAIAIIVERGGSGSAVSFIARNILDVYFNIQSYSDTQEREMALLR